MPKDDVSVLSTTSLKTIEQNPTEPQSVAFLKDYIAGKVDIEDTDQAYVTMKKYLKKLKKSSNFEIEKNVSKAEKKFNHASILRHKEAFRDDLRQQNSARAEQLSAHQFSIIDKKKELEKLSFEDLLLLSELLKKETDFKKDRKENQLRSYIQLRLDREKNTYNNNEALQKLALNFGTYQQKEKFAKVNSSTASTTDIPVFSAPINESLIIPNVSKENVISPQSIDEKTVQNKNTVKREEKRYVSDERAEFLSQHQFAILDKKKQISNLSSYDLLALNQLINKENGFNTTKRKDKLRNYINDRISKTLHGHIEADDGFAELVQELALPQQRNMYQKYASNYVPVKKSDNIIIIDSKETDKPQIKKEKKEEKLNWFQRSWRKLAILGSAAIIMVGSVTAAFNKFGKNSNESEVKNKTEVKAPQKVVSESFAQNDESTINFSDVKTDVSDIKTETATKDKLQEVRDKQYQTITTAFLNTVKIENAKENLDKFVDNIKEELSGDLTTSRVKYMLAFYQRFPGVEAGQVANKIMSGEDVKIDAQVLQKWSNELGTFGDKFVQSVKAKGTDSAIQKASKDLKAKYNQGRKDLAQAHQQAQQNR